jgi:hypothetical protein
MAGRTRFWHFRKRSILLLIALLAIQIALAAIPDNREWMIFVWLFMGISIAWLFAGLMFRHHMKR